MSDLTILAFVLASFAGGVGLKLLKVEPGSDKRQSEIYGRDIAGMIIIVLAISGAFLSLQSLQVTAAGSGGGLATYRCSDRNNILCYGPGVSGVDVSCNGNVLNYSCGPLINTGIWTDYPGPSYGTNFCGVGSINANETAGDHCTIFDTQNYNAEIFTNGPQNGLTVGFSVDCIKPVPTTPGGSVLYLEYANYSFTTWANVSNFKIVAGSIYVDNTASFPCPGTLADDTAAIPPTSSDGYEFRVVGVCGCPSGNFAPLTMNNVQVDLFRGIAPIIGIQLTGITTAHFLWRAQTDLPVASSTVVTLNWIATNQTSIACGTGDDCIQSNTSTCTIATNTSLCPTVTVTFANAFTGTVKVTESHSPAIGTTSLFLPIQSKVMFATQIGSF